MENPHAILADERIDEINEHLTLVQKKNGLTFGTDAYLLAAFCRAMRAGRAADFGCGTGVVALLLAARARFAHIYGVEVQESFASLARRNAARNDLTGRVSVLCRDVRALTPADFGGELDAVVANPPYMRADCGFSAAHSEKQIARHELCGDLAAFAEAAARCLKYGGLFYTVYRPDRLSTLFAALSGAGFAPKRMVFVHHNASSAPSMVLTEAKRGAAEGLSVLPPLFLYEPDKPNTLTPRAAQIYEHCSFYEEPSV